MDRFNRPYIRNFYQVFTPLYLPGEVGSFYLNPGQPISDPTCAVWVLYLRNCQTGVRSGELGGSFVQRLAVAGTVGWHLYCPSFICPDVPDGQYEFILYNANTDNVMFVSRIVLVSSSEDCLYRSTPVRFRHNDELFGVRYDLLPDFYQMYRLPLNQIKAPEPKADRDQYRQSSNDRALINAKSFLDIVMTVEMYYADDEAIDALAGMLEHTEVYISGNKIISMNQVKTEKPSELSGLQKGTFEIIVNNYGRDPQEPEMYGEMILWGGGTYSDINTFVTG